MAINYNNPRGTHSSPGVYSNEYEITSSVKSLGITTLGLVGETLRGPAFQVMNVGSWGEYVNMFGGTSPEKFKESQYPKYELPYIAKSYLAQSKQLQVCRVLGLSGYNAGPAWAVTVEHTKSSDEETESGTTETSKTVIAIIRSRGHYEKYHKYELTTGSCECPTQSFDTLFYEVGEPKNYSCSNPKHYLLEALHIAPYVPISSQGTECDGYVINGVDANFMVNQLNYGRFKVFGWTGQHDPNDLATYFTVPTGTSDNYFTEFSGVTATEHTGDNINKKYVVPTEAGMNADDYFEYAVTLNPNDKDYILKVLGTKNDNGDAPIYVESLYDVALKQMIYSDEVDTISSVLTPYQVYHISDYCGLKPVYGFMTKQEEELTRKDVGKRFLADSLSVANQIHCHAYDYAKNTPIDATKENDVTVGSIYTVVQYTDSQNQRHYFYRFYDKSSIDSFAENNEIDDITKVNAVDKLLPSGTASGVEAKAVLVKNNEDNFYYRLNDSNNDVTRVMCDLNDYKSQYRFASTPWVVSNVKGDLNKIELNRLFRFHTISDGNSSNNEIKVSIQNIKPDEGVFDVYVRDINDSDENIVVLERFQRCSLVPGTSEYISLKIGSYDGMYESKSKYITVEVIESDAVKNSVPCGFMGYPLQSYNGTPIKGDIKENVKCPELKYNVTYDQDKKNRKQYFGLSNIVGVDIDAFTFKGNMAYGEEQEYLSPGFHLDSRLNQSSYNEGEAPIIHLDGMEGYKFIAVDTNNRTMTLDSTPIIGTEAEMLDSIYEQVDLRKFTMYFYGGFDGWDEYRNYRSNTDDFKLSRYKGNYSEFSGEGYAFNKIDNADLIDLNQDGITSDWYAYLSGIRKFSNPEGVDINVFATPGIDIINNTLLVEEVIEMIEEERADSLYIVTLPDKPFGAYDYAESMYSPDDVVYELEDTMIDSNYTATYYPWIKYFDTDNNQYIYLPPTKDVVRNLALTDNQYQTWFASAGMSRGNVDCVRAKIVTKLADEDTLYDGRINPIKTFANDGVKIWGQKNLHIGESQLNRIAVRRLLLRMRKMIATACNGLIFDQLDSTTKAKFLSIVTPILDNIRANRGISDYKIVVNDSVESRDRRELPAVIYFKPYKQLEYITLTFTVTPESVSFDDI